MNAWNPTVINRRIPKEIVSSTQPTHVVTDQGNAYVKWPNNLQGPAALSSELLGTKLADWFGLPTFEYSVMSACPADAFADSGDERQVPVFLTKEVEGDTWRGTTKELELLENPEDLSRLVVFDSFVCNSDRYLLMEKNGQKLEHRNDGNVFLSHDAAPKKLRLRVYDHTHCYFAVIDATNRVPTEKLEDPAVYGLFPEFKGFLDREVIKEAAAKLLELDSELIQSIVDSVPDEWIINSDSRDRWKEFISGRAEFVNKTIERKIFPQGELNLG